MNIKKNALVIESHSDDSAISASGFILKYAKFYNFYFLLVCASSIRLNHIGVISREKRIMEYKKYVKALNGNYIDSKILPFDFESNLDTVPRSKIVKALEDVIGTVKPSVLIVQGPSFHHDHTITYESTIAATRPTSRFLPEEIYIMENPTYVHSVNTTTDFIPNFYVNLSQKLISKKLKIFKKCFPSQIRKSDNYLSESGILAWSRYRGIEARCKFAEAFKIYKIIK